MTLTSEQDFLDLLDRFFPNAGPGLVRGRGDDAAVIVGSEKLCLTTDLFVEDVHFRRRYFTPRDIGHKALAINLSDLAAMGARPMGFTLCLTVPPGSPDKSWWEELFAGMAGLAARHGVLLVGGDLSRGPSLSLAVTAWGPSARPLCRAQARTGDLVFLVGSIGLARTGLTVLERGMNPADWPRSVAAHLRPRPLVAEGLALAELDSRLSLMDVSDGLLRDLPRLVGPDLGVDLEMDPSGLHAEVLTLAGLLGLDPLEQAVLGGEDYALVGTVEPSGRAALEQALPGRTSIIGQVRTGKKLTLNGRALDHGGFDHFSKR